MVYWEFQSPTVYRTEKMHLIAVLLLHLTLCRSASVSILKQCINQSDSIETQQEIRCRFNALDFLPTESVKNLPNLKTLEFFKNGMTHVSTMAFLNLKSLKSLTISNNNIKILSNNVFLSLPVDIINVASNKIRIIEKSAFNTLPNLLIVYLENNLLTKWDPDWFADTPNLEFIDLSKNQISSLQAFAFTKFSKLKKFWLADNKLCAVDPNTFNGSPPLNYLNLAGNLLRSLHSKTFENLFKKEDGAILNLQQNYLGYLQDGLLESLKSLRYLTLKDNPLTCPCYFKIIDWAGKNKVIIDKIVHTNLDRQGPVCVAPKTKFNCDDEEDTEAFYYYLLINKFSYEECSV